MMKDFNAKAKIMQEFLTENKVGYFLPTASGDALHTVVFRSELLVSGERLPVVLLTDDSIYALLKILVVTEAEQGDNRPVITAKLNEWNSLYKLFKYSLTAEGDIVLDISLPGLAEQFEPRLVMSVLEVALKHLEEEYGGVVEALSRSLANRGKMV